MTLVVGSGRPTISNTLRTARPGDRAEYGSAGPATARKPAPTKLPMDKLLLILAITLIGVGLVTVFDASYATALRTNRSPYYLFSKQVHWALYGLAAFLIALRVPYWKWRKYAFSGICVATSLLVLVLIPHIGHSINGARRWIGPMQPSEFAKLALVIYLAQFAAAKGSRLKRFRSGLLWPSAVMAVVCVLIAKEPDLGTAIVVCGTSMVLFYVAGASRRQLSIMLAAAVTGVILYSLADHYRVMRLFGFMHPETSYQVWHSLIAIGSGGIPGLGLGDGIEKIFIPMASTDFIFPVIAEEWGFIGAVVLIGLFLLVAVRGYSIAHSTRDPFGALLAAGLTTLIALQSVINIGVATSSIPNTGVPLPFISYGGSALLLAMTSIGMLLNISRYPDGPGHAAAGPSTPSEKQFENRWKTRGTHLHLRN